MKKSRAVRFVLLGSAVLVAGMLFCYAMVAFRPTGYRRVRMESADAQEEVNRVIRTLADRDDEIPAVSTPDSDRDDTTGTVVVAQIARKKTDILPERDFFVAIEDLATQYETVFGQRDTQARDVRFAMGSDLGSSFYRLPTGLPGDAEATGSRTPTAKDIRFLAAETGCALAWKRHVETADPVPSTAVADRVSTPALHALLDATEDFLLRSKWSVPAYESCPYLHPETGAEFQIASILTIARAGLAHDRDKADRLLVSYFEARRITLHLENPMGWYSLDLAPAALTWEMNFFTDAGLARAQRVLEESILTPEQSRRLAAAYPLRYGNVAKQNLQRDRVETPGTGLSPAWRRTSRWVTWTVVRPIVSNQIERTAVAGASGDTQETTREFAKLGRLHTLMNQFGLENPVNVDQSLVADIIPNPQAFEYTRRTTHEIRLALAMGRYRWAVGRFPVAVAELVPDYLPDGFMDLGFAIDTLPEGNCLWLHSDNGLDASPVFSTALSYAVGEFWAEHERLPADTDEIAPYFVDPSEGNSPATEPMNMDTRVLPRSQHRVVFEGAQRRVDAQPVLYSLEADTRLQSQPTEEAEAWLCGRSYIPISMAQKESILRSYRETPEEARKIDHLTARTTSLPVVPDALMRLLGDCGVPNAECGIEQPGRSAALESTTARTGMPNVGGQVAGGNVATEQAVASGDTGRGEDQDRRLDR